VSHDREVGWVLHEATVTANTVGPNSYPYSGGVVVGFSDMPQVKILRPDGTVFWWRADLCTEQVPVSKT